MIPDTSGYQHRHPPRRGIDHYDFRNPPGGPRASPDGVLIAAGLAGAAVTGSVLAAVVGLWWRRLSRIPTTARRTP